MREAFRQVLHMGLLKPLGALVVEELQAKLDPAAALDFSALAPGISSGTQPRPRITRQSWTHTAGSRSHRGTR